MNLMQPIIELFYPTHCLVCRKTGAVVHPNCRASLPFVQEPFCHRCSQRLYEEHCRSQLCTMPDQQRALTGIRSVFWHTGGGREAVLRLKYRGISSLRDWAGVEVAQALKRFQLADYFEIVMPVPLHPTRLRQRGYNQSDIVAGVAARQLQRPYWKNRLVRVKATESQVKLNGQQRSSNMQQAFGWQGPKLAGQKILLFDDVCTTGATLNECAYALKEAGAGEVWAITLTREQKLEIRN